MSKGGGAAKVYFVLYLAVVLELLIIIVDRDEAEENLHRQQKETMSIVESILTQLQTGSGSEGINTKPQDQITLLEPGTDMKSEYGVEISPDRQYLVEVGVTDITDELGRREGEGDNEYTQRVMKLIQLGNVEDLEYQIFYSSSTDPANAPSFPTEEDIRKNKIDFTHFSVGQTVPGVEDGTWEFMGLKKLSLDEEKTFSQVTITKNTKKIELDQTNPYYKVAAQTGSSFVPGKLPQDSAFFYSKDRTDLRKGLKKRTFVVNFEPPRKAGWYKLRFASRTNRILGVRATQKVAELNEDSKVNIGTVQLTVGDLQKVNKELLNKLDKYGLPSSEILSKENDLDKFDAKIKESQQRAFKEENGRDLVGKIQLYGYITKLLTPGQSIYFPQNRGSIEFNIRVILPESRQATPEVVVPEVRCFDKLPAVFDFTISPFNGEGGNKVSGIVKNSSGGTVCGISCVPMTKTPTGTAVPSPARGGKRDYIGTVDKALPAGQYTIVVTHSIGGKSTPRENTLTIYESSLTDESKKNIQNIFDRKAYYATSFLANQSVVPSSGGAIRPEEFRIYLSTDDQGSQVTPIEGLDIPQSRAPYLTSKSNQVKMKVTWKQPLTGKEIDVLPEISHDIRLKQPQISQFEKQEQENMSGNKWTKTINRVTVTAPQMDKDTRAKCTIKVGTPQLDGIESSVLNLNDVIFNKTEENGIYTCSFELSGTVKMPAGKTVMDGNITIPISVTATGNGKTSSNNASITTTVEIKKEARTSGGRNTGVRSSGGSSSSSSGSGSSQRKTSGSSNSNTRRR